MPVQAEWFMFMKGLVIACPIHSNQIGFFFGVMFSKIQI